MLNFKLLGDEVFLFALAIASLIKRSISLSNAAIFFSGGFDYSEMLIEEDLDVNNLDILTNGKISEFEGNIIFKKGKFFTINFNLINRKILKNKSLFSNPTLHAEKLKYSNRITLNKLYYIDKGIFSFLIKVNKLN